MIGDRTHVDVPGNVLIDGVAGVLFQDLEESHGDVHCSFVSLHSLSVTRGAMLRQPSTTSKQTRQPGRASHV